MDDEHIEPAEEHTDSTQLSPSETDGDTADADDRGDDTAESEDRDSQVKAAARNKVINMAVTGDLRVYFAECDVTFTVDGDAALRLMACWQGARHGQDRLDPLRSTALVGWIGVDVQRVLALSWTPHLTDSSTVDRVTIDPVDA